MKTEQIDIKKIQDEIRTKKNELNNLKLDILLDKEKNKHLIKAKKKQIARLLTTVNSK